MTIETNNLEKLSIVQSVLNVKKKERCKFWPICRQGDQCEFVHPSINCEKFPNCIFGDNCLYLHPTCKFGRSCTKMNCLYSHLTISKSIGELKLLVFFYKLNHQYNFFFVFL